MQLPSGPLRRDVVVVGSGPARQRLRLVACPSGPAGAAGRPAGLSARQGLRRWPDSRRTGGTGPPGRARRGAAAGAPGAACALRRPPRWPCRRTRPAGGAAAPATGPHPASRGGRRGRGAPAAGALRVALARRRTRSGGQTAARRPHHRGRGTLAGPGHRSRAAGGDRCGVCDRRTPSGVALRGYFRHPALAEAASALEIVWHRAWPAATAGSSPRPMACSTSASV
jgi:hypothetical protein